MASAQVNDSVSNFNETLEHHVEVLRPSKLRQDVFRAIYRGKRDPKTVSELMDATGLDQKSVLTAGLALANNHIVDQVKVSTSKGGRQETAYKKTAFCSQHKKRYCASWLIQLV